MNIKKIVLLASVMMFSINNITYTHGGLGCCGESHESSSTLSGTSALKGAITGEISIQHTLGIIVIAGPLIAWWNKVGSEQLDKLATKVVAYCSTNKKKSAKSCCMHHCHDEVEHTH